jgi:hypothetical protein
MAEVQEGGNIELDLLFGVRKIPSLSVDTVSATLIAVFMSLRVNSGSLPSRIHCNHIP